MGGVHHGRQDDGDEARRTRVKVVVKAIPVVSIASGDQAQRGTTVRPGMSHNVQYDSAVSVVQKKVGEKYAQENKTGDDNNHPRRHIFRKLFRQHNLNPIEKLLQNHSQQIGYWNYFLRNLRLQIDRLHLLQRV